MDLASFSIRQNAFMIFIAGQRYHFLVYLNLFIGVTGGIALAKMAATPILWQGSFSLWSMLGMFLIIAIFSGLVGWLTQLLESNGTWLSWYPGIGWKTHNGEFRPMPWAALVGLFQRAASGVVTRLYRLIQSEQHKRIPFAFGPANQGETVLRGTVVMDGYDFADDQAKTKQNLRFHLHVGEVALAANSEGQHYMIAGKTGAGKTQVINACLKTIRARGQVCMIADPAGGYMARFGNENSADILLNPFDLRTQNWSPFAEIRADYDFPRIAKAAIPDAEGSSQEWNFYAQSLLAETMKAMHKRGDTSMKKLLWYCTSAEQDELRELLAGGPAEILTAPGNSKMLSNTRSIISLYLSAWSYLQDNGDFSIRDWVRNVDAGNGGWLFMTYKDEQMALLKFMIATWCELAIIEGLSLPEDEQRRLFYVLDELDSLGKITSLRAGLTKLRKYGGVVIAGIQTIAQLRTTYGRDEAQTLLSCMSTKLALSQGDNETAEYMSAELGEQEIERDQVSSGTSAKMGELAPHQSTNLSKHRQVQKAVLPSQLTALPNLHGYLKIDSGRVLQVVVPWRKYEEQAKPFIDRSI